MARSKKQQALDEQAKRNAVARKKIEIRNELLALGLCPKVCADLFNL